MATNRTEVVVHIHLPTALHARLRRKAFDEEVPMKDAVVQAIEGWLAPATRHAKAGPDLDQVRAEARALGMRELATAIIEGQGSPQALLHEAEDAAGLEHTLV